MCLRNRERSERGDYLIGSDLLFFDGNFTMIMAIRLIIALILCALIGMEREFKNQTAGLRTHILVGVGSCMMMLLSVYGLQEYVTDENSRYDVARIPSYVISGMGFIGGGAILKNGDTIKGLTTAASLWVVAGIGLLVGAGMIELALMGTIVVLIALYLLKKWEAWLEKKGISDQQSKD